MVSDPQWHQLELAAEMLKALADPHRLGILLRLSKRELSVGELAEIEQEKVTTMSARLKVLLTAHLVKRRRKGQSVLYSLADTHVLNLVDNAIEHACEGH
ncbi:MULTISPECIES: ArsR/SmtB family transcription factor [Nitrobacter]|nr:metalloregulator ArsR/SmtB family transcription factor [Nitrobacter winogradskyi]